MAERSNLSFKEWIKSIRLVGEKRKRKLLVKYGDIIREALEKIEEEQVLGRFLKENLGSYFQKIKNVWGQYKRGEIGKNELITLSGLALGKKFIDIFIHESREVLRVRKGSVYLTLNAFFGVLFAFCIIYFIFLMPVDVTAKPKGNFILPGNERYEWVFAMVMALIMVFLCGYLASFFLKRLTLRLYLKSMRKNQKIGLVPTEIVFGSALYRKLIFRAMIAGFLAFNLSYTLASNIIFVEWMRSVEPEGVNLIPDPELMMHIMWIVAIPCVLILVPLWLMMDIGLVKTNPVKGAEVDSVNLAGSKFYKFIKGYASIGFFYNLFLIVFIWASDDVPLIRVFMRFISPIIVISFMFPVVVLIDYNNEKFKKKLWKQLKKYELNKKLHQDISVETVETYDQILEQ